jgi:predicted nucleotidyltransferase
MIALMRKEITQVLHSFGVEAAGVFGSIAHGDDSETSDIDLLVKFQPGTSRDLIRLTDALEQLTGYRVDILDHQRLRDRAAATGIGARILAEPVPL